MEKNGIEIVIFKCYWNLIYLIDTAYGEPDSDDQSSLFGRQKIILLLDFQ